MKTLNFKFQLKHTAPSGIAIVVSSNKEGLEHASEHFKGDFKTEIIGAKEGYYIYENYQDSGSNDYFYFAIKN